MSFSMGKGGRVCSFKNVTLRALALLLVLPLILLVIVFVLDNNQPVSLFFFGWSGPQLPLSAFVILSFLLGAAIGPALAWCVARRVKRKY